MCILDERAGEFAILEGQRRREIEELESFVLDPSKPFQTVRPVLKCQQEAAASDAPRSMWCDGVPSSYSDG